MLGISMDSFASNKEFGAKIGVKFPLLSDWNRKATQAFGLYNEQSGYGTRGTFVVDKEGIIRHVEVGRTAIDPTGAFQACETLKKKSEPAKP